MVVSFVWEMAENVTDGPYASLPPSHFLVFYSASAGILFVSRLVNQDGNLANGYCCFCFTSCFTSCLGDGTRRLVLFQVGVGWDTMG